MEPNLMRKIDQYLGIPLCFLVTVFYKIQRLIGINNPRFNAHPKNILFVELAEMGSIVVAYPAVKELIKMYQDVDIYFLSFRNIRESIEILNITQNDKLFTIDNKSMISLIKDTFKFMYLSRRKKIDTAIILDAFARYSTILGYLSGARKRVGFFRYYQEGLYIGNFLTHKIIYNSHMHASQSFLSLVRSLKETDGQIPFAKFAFEDNILNVPRILSPPIQRENIWHMLKRENPSIDSTKKLVVINPNASKLISIRKWPLENYAELAKKLLCDEEIYIAITGLESEKSDAEFICNYVKNEHLLNLSGKTQIKDLIHLINIAHVLITNDSGPAHFASLTNTPIVVFFGPESPSVYGPLSENCTILYSHYACSPCVSVYNKRLSPCNDNMCLKVIRVEYVYETVKNILYHHTPLQ